MTFKYKPWPLVAPKTQSRLKVGNPNSLLSLQYLTCLVQSLLSFWILIIVMVNITTNIVDIIQTLKSKIRVYHHLETKVPSESAKSEYLLNVLIYPSTNFINLSFFTSVNFLMNSRIFAYHCAVWIESSRRNLYEWSC